MLPFYKLLANRYQRFTSSTTWDPPFGVTAVFARVQAGGGGGGGGSSRLLTVAGHGGSGGGSGQLIEGFVDVSGGSVSVVVGAGGAGGTAGDTTGGGDIGPSPGSVGGNSSFGSLVAIGGKGGLAQGNGLPSGELAGADRQPTGTPGGNGTAAANNPIQLIGKRGMAGLHGSSSGAGVALGYIGASSALIYGTETPPYLACSATIAKGGSGASSEYGPGGAGGLVGDPGAPIFCGTPDDLNADDTPASSYGAGGGGGGPRDHQAGVAGTGSAGASGLVEIWYLQPATLDADVICGPPVTPPGPPGGGPGDGPSPGANPLSDWKLFRVSWLHDAEPYDLVHMESQETTHGYSGFHFERDGWLNIRSSAVVALTVEIDGVTQTPSYTIPSTGNTRRKVYIPFMPNKGKLYRYLLDSADPFHVYSFQIRAKGWDESPYQMVPGLTGTESPWEVDAERGEDPRII